MTIRTGSKLLTYSELILFATLEERYNYVKLDGIIGETTFGYDRVFNQKFYASSEWKLIRHKIITRDMGCELGLAGYEIQGTIYIHHLNPITMRDIELKTERLLSPENLVCVSYNMHYAITYGNNNMLPIMAINERRANDTCPWKY